MAGPSSRYSLLEIKSLRSQTISSRSVLAAMLLFTPIVMIIHKIRYQLFKLGGIQLYYNPYSYFIYSNPYPMWMMSNHSSFAQFPKHLAMPTSPSNNNPFPPVDTHKLKTSAKSIQTIFQQAHLLTNKIAESDQFAHDLMNAAQLSNKAKVDQLIVSTGITIKFETKFTPDGIQIRFMESDCCGLTMILDW